MPAVLRAAPRWLPGGHLQTIWPARLSRSDARSAARPGLHRERWVAPDGDFIDVDWQPGPPDAPTLVLFHGLEGSSASHYARAVAHWARERGWRLAMPHFRGCSGSLNAAPRAYHSGDHDELDWILARLRAEAGQPLRAVGVSLGGNALLRWAQTQPRAADGQTVAALAAVCAPLDLAACADAIDRGFAKRIYTPMFLRTMKPKALAKWAQHPGLFDAEAVRRARSLRAFDDAFTAPLHGFRDVADYYARASAGPHLAQIRIPSLVLNPLNDPFVPAGSLPDERTLGAAPVSLWRPAGGGHVGLAQGAAPGDLRPAWTAILDALAGLAAPGSA